MASDVDRWRPPGGTVFAVSGQVVGWLQLRERINAAPFPQHFSHWHRGPLAFATICRELLGSAVSIVKFN